MTLTFRKPRDLLTEVEAAMAPIPSDEFFNKPSHKSLRERWCAAIFGLGYERHIETCEVAFNGGSSRPDVDFYLRVSGRELRFQLTEVQEPGRERGYEAKHPETRTSKMSAENERRGAEDGPAWIREAVRRKAEKYGEGGKDLYLLVYANFAVEKLDVPKVSEPLGDLRAAFAEVWIMDSTRIALISAESPGSWLEARDIREYYEAKPTHAKAPSSGT